MITIDNFKKQQLQEIPIESVAARLGIHVTRHHALCFMHDDHHPSLAFFPAKNQWKCFVCNVGGDTISLVMKYNNQSFVDACLWLADNFGIEIDVPKGTKWVKGTGTVTQKLGHGTCPLDPPNPPDLEILQYIVDNFRLTDTAKHFLFQERKYSEEVVAKLRICAIDDDRLLVKYLVTRFGEERVLKCQLAYKYRGKLISYFHAPCLFFPYFDVEGKLIGLQARYLGDPELHQRFQFPKGSSTHIFNQPILKELQPKEPLFISEGVTDAIALLSAGYKAIAIPSATLLKAQEMKQVTDHTLLMYPDNDEPGENLFKQLKEIVDSCGGSITKLYLPEGCKDFSEYYKNLQKK